MPSYDKPCGKCGDNIEFTDFIEAPDLCSVCQGITDPPNQDQLNRLADRIVNRYTETPIITTTNTIYGHNTYNVPARWFINHDGLIMPEEENTPF